MNAGNVEVTGLDELLKKLDEKFNTHRIAEIETAALKVSSQTAVVYLKNAVSAYEDTGQTVDEVTAGATVRKGGMREINVGWSGSGTRWRLVHLNEWGYTPHGVFAGHTNASTIKGHLGFYAPRGYGVIQKTFERMREPIQRLQIMELRKLMR